MTIEGGVVHALKQQVHEKSRLVVTTKCGETISRRTTERLEGATAWASAVTCEACASPEA